MLISHTPGNSHTNKLEATLVQNSDWPTQWQYPCLLPVVLAQLHKNINNSSCTKVYSKLKFIWYCERWVTSAQLTLSTQTPPPSSKPPSSTSQRLGNFLPRSVNLLYLHKWLVICPCPPHHMAQLASLLPPPRKALSVRPSQKLLISSSWAIYLGKLWSLVMKSVPKLNEREWLNVTYVVLGKVKLT